MDLMQFLNTVVTPWVLTLVMFGLGISLTVGDFKRVVTFPKAATIGLAGQLIGMPLAAFVLAYLMAPNPAIAVGLVILGACPAGTTSNAYSFAARADVALCVTLSAITSVVTVFTIPLLTYVALQAFFEQGQIPELPVGNMLWTLARVTLIPVVGGMIFRKLFPQFTQKLLEPIRKLAMVLLIVVLAGAAASSWHPYTLNPRLLGRLGARRSDVRRCASLARASGSAAEGPIALVSAIADVLVRGALDHPWRRPDVGRAMSALAEISDLPETVVRSEIHARVAADPRMLQLSPAVAIETQMKLLYALLDLEQVSLWTRNPLEGPTSRFHVPRRKPDRRARMVARAVLESGYVERFATTYGLPVLRWQRPDGAIVFSAPDADPNAVTAAARNTFAAIAVVLEREALLLRSAARERALVEPRERLLTRLGFDLHDGPIQDVAALAGDIRLLRTQLQEVLAATGAPGCLIGRIDDLEARIGAVDHALRQMVHSLESPGMTRRPLDEALRREVEAFQDEADVAVDLVVRGDTRSLTDSQSIAIIRIVQESLTIIREHAHASRVSVAVMAGPSEITIDVNDDGRGFHVERTLVRSARAGRLEWAQFPRSSVKLHAPLHDPVGLELLQPAVQLIDAEVGRGDDETDPPGAADLLCPGPR